MIIRSINIWEPKISKTCNMIERLKADADPAQKFHILGQGRLQEFYYDRGGGGLSFFFLFVIFIFMIEDIT